MPPQTCQLRRENQTQLIEMISQHLDSRGTTAARHDETSLLMEERFAVDQSTSSYCTKIELMLAAIVCGHRMTLAAQEHPSIQSCCIKTCAAKSRHRRRGARAMVGGARDQESGNRPPQGDHHADHIPPTTNTRQRDQRESPAISRGDRRPDYNQ